MRILSPLAALALATALLCGCGESEVKRSVDARIEALRFYDADAPLVALVETTETAGISSAGLSSLGSLPPWGSLLAQAERRLRAAGLPPASLDRLVRGSEAVEGLPGSQLTIGLSPPQASLLVLVTDTPEEMDQLVEQAVRNGKLSSAGELDDARIFKSRDGAFAVRDGVMLAAASTARLRAAIRTRDGDRDAQLDDQNVQSLLDEVPEQAPLDVYANPAPTRPGPIREAAFALRGAPGGLRVDAFARLAEGGTQAALPLWRLVSPAPARQTTARVDGDELRVTLRTFP